MRRFRKGADVVLVTKDIASGGIGVPAAGHVINIMFPGSLIPTFIAPAGFWYA